MRKVRGEVTQAVIDIVAERRRQIESEGWTRQHDDEHVDGELGDAASAYALGPAADDGPPIMWPWGRASWKPSDRRHNLVRAAALLVAEIERLDRLKNKA